MDGIRNNGTHDIAEVGATISTDSVKI